VLVVWDEPMESCGRPGSCVRSASGGRGTCTCGVQSPAVDVTGYDTLPRTGYRRPALAAWSGLHSGLSAYCELIGGCRRRRIKGNAL
jgi:hypothetical protein